METKLISSSPLTKTKLRHFLSPYSKPLIATSIRCSLSTPNMSKPPGTGDDRRLKVVVCGGGVIGVCTAYFLAKNGASVTVVEQSSVACAASGKAGGFLALDWCDGGPLSSLARTSFNLHRSLSDELDGPSSYGYRPLDTLSVAIDESHSKPSSNVKNLPSWVDGPAQKSKPIGTAQTTAQVHPQLFTRCLMTNAVEKYGAEVVIGRVDEVGFDEKDEGRVDSVVLNDGRVLYADSVVLALGPWSSKLALVSSLFRVYGLKAHSIVLEPKEPDLISPHALFLTYYPAHGGRPMDPEVYPRPTGEVYICGMSSTEEVPDDPEQVTPNPESIKILKQVAGNVSTHLKEGEAQVTAEQACFLPSTDDGVPVIGELPGMKGCFVATGHSCWGILNGPATGAALAELVIAGKTSIADLSPFSPARFVLKSKR
ncbi:putative oxidoreductase TDA3 [Chenopodium quinoa]|uniref:FAD dependent oxidoreductase domain-containing protein n=1 Tax=Chenopodium quinoa TaxID=63459 RepID=A0A803KY29_CHEQI|nr:putative oxidoreductase TDA3 [Chenopodium quinoa]